MPVVAPVRSTGSSGKRLDPSIQILIGLSLGAAVGLLVGESASVLQPAADIYIRLMQMTVLPYLVVTLVGGLGQLDEATARRLGGRAALLIGLVAAVTLVVIGAMPLAFPPFESASFYSDALIEPKQPFALGELYVPSNPFNAMANAVVPGVVLFSSALGVALIRVPGKEALLASVQALEKAVVRVTRFMFRLTPYGVFAITASVAGTIQPDSLARLQVYFVVFGLASVVLAFVVLPVMVTAVTPFRYREIVAMCRDALITAFVASSVFIVLPMLVEKIKQALTEHGLDAPGERSSVEVVVPIAFVVPNAGKLLTLLFVPYAAWYSGTPLHAQDYPGLFAAGVPSYFAKAQVALPFLMDLLGVPHDLFQLYIPASIVTGKFDSMLSAMSLLAVALMTASAVAGRFRLETRSLVTAALSASAAIVVTVVLARLLLAATIDTSYTADQALRNMHLPRETVPATLRPDAPDPAAGDLPALQRIRESGVLRVAIVADRVPFSFVNARGDLVGMDVEVAQRLARDLGAARVEFVAVDSRQMAPLLEARRIDMALGLPYLRELLSQVTYSLPYLDGTVGLVVRDRDRDTYASIDALRGHGPVTIGLLADLPSIKELLQDHLAGVPLRFVELASAKEFLSGSHDDVDALAMLAESGAAWSILYPSNSVVVPQPHPISLPLGVALRRGDAGLRSFVDDWLVIQRASGTLRQAREYWVLGHGAQHTRRRWSILHDVMGIGEPRPSQPAGPSR